MNKNKDIRRITSNNQVFVDATWFKYGGVVLVQDQLTLEYKAYISGIKGDNRDINDDVEQIMGYGSKLEKCQMHQFFTHVVFDETKEWYVNNPEFLL